MLKMKQLLNGIMCGKSHLEQFKTVLKHCLGNPLLDFLFFYLFS